MEKPLQFPATVQAGGHVLGQPFSIVSVYAPVNVTLTCNCGGNDTVEIVGSHAAECPTCRKVYNAGFNPVQNKLEFKISAPVAEQVPS